MLRLVLVAAVVSLVTTGELKENRKNYTSQTVEWFNQNAQTILKSFDAEYSKFLNNYILARWNYYKNMTKENLAARKKAMRAPDSLIEVAELGDRYVWSLKDEHMKRQFKKITTNQFISRVSINESSVHGFSFEELASSIYQMETIYDNARICDFMNKTKCYLAFDEIEEIMRNSRDPEELKYMWVEWRKASGEQVKSLYPKYVEYVNIVARHNNFSDQAAYWISNYEVDNFTEQIENVWQQLKPLYLQLHAYVRRELRKKYGEDLVSKDGPIPAHLLGSMWAQSWSNIANFTTPFPDKQMPDFTAALLKQGYNATGIFRLAEDFFKSINLSAMPDTFWERSILEKQKDVIMRCYPKAWDFYDGKDFRITQCTRVDMENLLTAHYEMALIEYAMQYKDQPAIFKEGANPVFQKAVANALTLSVFTPKHLKKIGLLRKDSINQKAFFNHLYLMGIDMIAFMPFAYMMERWRWNVFQGNVTPDNYNCHWWSLAAEYQGIEPPVNRSEEDFDPGAQFHIIANFEYIKYFVSKVLQFQIHRLLCRRSAYPLHKCNIYGNKNVGNLLKSMMELGSSKPWPDAMEKIKGQRQMNAAGFLKYFQPLMKWLKKKNKKTKEYIGWKSSTKRCVKTRKELIIKTGSDEL